MESFDSLFWQAYMINFLFWTCLAQGAVILAAILDIALARSMHQYVQISRKFAAFLPVSVLLFLGLAFGGRGLIFPWIDKPIPKLIPYLNFPFFVLRGSAGLGLLAVLSWIFLAKTKVRYPGSGRPKGATPWAVILLILFMIIYYYLATDLVISLAPDWYSTLFGAYYSFGALYLGSAGLCIAGYFGKNLRREDRRKLSLLLFGFGPFWIYLLWSQYIVIWYGDLPELTLFVGPRFYIMPWEVVTWMVIGFVFVLPFFILLSKRAKLVGAFPLLASLCAVIGFMLEKYMLIVPSFSPYGLGIGWIHFWITLAYAILFVICYRVGAFFLKTRGET